MHAKIFLSSWQLQVKHTSTLQTGKALQMQLDDIQLKLEHTCVS